MKSITEILDQIAPKYGYKEYVLLAYSPGYIGTDNLTAAIQEAAEIYANQSKQPLSGKEISNQASAIYFKRYSGFTSEQIQLDRIRSLQISAFKEGAKFAERQLLNPLQNPT